MSYTVTHTHRNGCFCLFCGVRQAQWFRQHQQSTVEQVKGQLWSHWLPKCIEVFRRLPPVPINNDVKAYYRCAYLYVAVYADEGQRMEVLLAFVHLDSRQRQHLMQA